ncbi:Cc-nbs-lrr resistance protein, putative isoform 1 [Theobroma cacao]|uniref:Cc-nbs-lrr resistance protein, putative isoform 1 n=2 Tax=Theobroma cacao TaxID=3641 RepID=A0A061DW17_THECC|nr:Cc-nbs-lrr resistance protein, putative isoform 1 [Theobroma cacao]EOX96601.1 Cc-nbs-lrr resistance protein, putative isoform 1 [Theobroma cacao]EOX96602.1 Cc-nbs-lrr resistance protein, putative isoform 1 [Theobroma cacao]
MEVIVASVSDVMLSALVRSLLETMSSPDFLKFSREEQVWAEIKKWKNLLLKINALLQDAEEKQTTSGAVKLWLRDLQHVAFDAEDAVDELATESLRRKLLEQAQPSASTSKLWKVILPTCFSALNLNGIKFNAKMNSKIQEITSRLHDLAVLKNNLNLVEFSGGRREKVLHRLPTSSLVDEPHVYGRESDKDAIVDMLMDSGEMGRGEVGVVSIVGMAGVGKTTLAQLVYHDERIETSFELRAWACVTEEFDILRVTKTVLHAVDSDIGNSQDLNLLQVRLKEKLIGRKFLIILDDLWNENYGDWDVLCKPFAAGAPGSKILVTTRHKRVAAVTAVTANNEAYHLKELSDDACLSLFTWHALRAGNFDGHPNLKVVGEQIVRKCKGLPLAAKTLGGLLRTKVTQEEWEDILMSKIWDLPEERSGILPALRLSYHHLPFYLKQCFAYCAIFPKDYEFDKDELVLLWMAEGFLQQLKGKTRMEDLGSQYFNELLSRSIFQQSTSNKARYVMHDLINDLAQSVSDEICSSLDDMDMVEGDKLCTVAEKVRHLSFTRRQYDIRKRFEVLYQMKNLRTLAALPIYTSPWSACCYLAGDVLQKMLRRLSCLRVLCLSCYCINELPNSIGHLKHLRYLNLSRSRIKQLPESVGSLLNLQTLILQGCKELTKLPQVFKNLVNLRVLDLTDTDSLQEMPFGIGNLKNLQILSKFIVGKGIGSAVSELRGLLHLRGELSISGLENVVDIQDASKANLKDKYGLTRLYLQWSQEFLNCRDEEAEMHVLDRLLPHKNLEKLRILFYGGTIFPSWLGEPSLTDLVDLELCNCRNSISLPSLGRLPSLKMLSIAGMARVQKVGLEFYGHISPSVKPFPSLEILRFKSMLEWRCWSSPSQVAEHSGEEFPCLRELVIEDCPKLCGKLPGRVFSLMKLVIKHCPNLEGSSMSFPSLCELNMEDCKEELLRSIVGITSLTTVRAKSMPELQFVQNDIAQFPGTLKFLVISNCIGLTSLWQKGAISLNISCLESLKIKGRSQFVSLAENDQGLSSNLEDLRLLDSCNVWNPPWMMHGLTSLKDLQIESCPNLVFFPELGFLHTLKHLKLKDCRALKSLPSGMMMLNCKINGCPLEELEIEDCHSLTCFPRGRLPTTLKCIRIRYCRDLMSLPEGLMLIDNSASNISLLEILEIVACPSLISFPEGRLPTSLKNLKIWNCSQLEPISDRMLHKNASLESIDVWNCKTLISLPENLHSVTHLTELKFSLCPALRYFPETGMHLPNLRTLEIYNCDNLKSLPNHMLSLTSLRCLSVSECPGLLSIPKGGLPPNLSVLDIWDCQNLKQPMSEWNLHSLAFLRELSIAGGPDAITFPDEKCLLPTSLVCMFISRLQNLQSLSMGLYNLTLLEDLEIVECPKLQRLPKEGLPETLGRLCIRDCQLLNQHCLKEKGAYWPVIAHIPRLEIENTDD